MSARKINIVPNRPEFQQDFACRWKMDALRVKKEGHGKNIRTCILNITTVAEQLNIPHSPQYISKYLALELGSRTQWDKNRKVALIKGVHSQETLQDKLHGFLELFILCPNCWAPELRHKWKSGRKGRVTTIARCMACGWEGHSLRTGHGVGKFITRNPPPKGKTAKRADTTGFDQIIKAKRVVPVVENWDKWTLGTNKAEVQDPPQPKCVNVTASEDSPEPEPDSRRAPKTTEQWWEEMHKAGKERQPTTPLGLLRAVLAQPDCKLIDVVSEFLRLEAAHKLDQLASTKLVLDASLDFRGNELTGVALFDALSKSIEQNRFFLNWFTSQAQSDRMRSDCDMMLMSHIENELVNRGMVKDVAQVLEVLYDNYVFDAEFFVSWAEKKTGYVLRDPTDLELVRNAAAPFVRWAQSQQATTVETEI